MYPEGWPKCPVCGNPALDGKLTCGEVRCSQALHERRRNASRVASAAEVQRQSRRDKLVAEVLGFLKTRGTYADPEAETKLLTDGLEMPVLEKLAEGMRVAIEEQASKATLFEDVDPGAPVLVATTGFEVKVPVDLPFEPHVVKVKPAPPAKTEWRAEVERTVHELRNALVPALELARRGDFRATDGIDRGLVEARRLSALLAATVDPSSAERTQSPPASDASFRDRLLADFRAAGVAMTPLAAQRVIEILEQMVSTAPELARVRERIRDLEQGLVAHRQALRKEHAARVLAETRALALYQAVERIGEAAKGGSEALVQLAAVMLTDEGRAAKGIVEERDELREAYEAAKVQLQRASGALCDASSVPTGPTIEVGIRALIAERDEARRLLAEVRKAFDEYRSRRS